MNVKVKDVKQLKLTDLEGLDPITVYTDEWEKSRDDGSIQYQGRITIICYDTILSYFWEAMNEPLEYFFIHTNVEYLIGKFIQASYWSYCPVAHEISYTQSGRIQEKEADVSIDMSDNQKEYIIKVIKAVQAGIRELIAQSEGRE